MITNLKGRSLIFLAGLLLLTTSYFRTAKCQIDKTLQVESGSTTTLSETQAKVYTDIIINEPATKVWAVLRDFENMPKWSSSFKGISGDIRNGGSVIAKFDLGNGQAVDVPHKSLIYQEGILFGWSEEITMFPGLFDNHRYRVEAISPCQTRFIQNDEVKGTNATISPKMVIEMMLPQYQTFNKELKAAVEKQ